VVWWLLGVVGLGVSGWGVLSTYRMLHPRPRPLTIPQSLPPVRTVSLVSRGREPFELWVLHADQPRGVIVACHGYHVHRLQLIERAQGLCQRGYTVLLFDLHGHGSRRGACTFGVRDVEDIGVILHWLKQQPELASLPVGVFGLSLGGAIACQAAARFSEVRALVVDSMYARLFPIMADAIRRLYHLPALPWAWVTWLGVQVALGRRLSRVDPLVLASQIRRPILIIHGAGDESVPVEHARALYARWQGPKAQWIEPTVGHVGMSAADLAGYCDRVAGFFDQWLTPQSP